MINYMYLDTFETKTGLQVHARPMLPDDAPYLVDLFEHMSAESRYRRFMQPVDRIGTERIWAEAENIAHGATGETYGLVAFADLDDRADVPVAGARYVKLSAGEAEIAVSVRDDMQNMGIGTHLLRLLSAHAAENDIDQLVGTVQNDNVVMWLLLRKLGYRLEQQAEGSYSLITLHLHESEDIHKTESRTEDWLDAPANFSPEPQIIG